MMYAIGEVKEVRVGYSKKGVAWARVTLACGSKQARITGVAFGDEAEAVMEQVEEGMHVQLTLDPYWRKDESSDAWDLQLKVTGIRIREGKEGNGNGASRERRKQPQREQPQRRPQRAHHQRPWAREEEGEEEEAYPF